MKTLVVLFLCHLFMTSSFTQERPQTIESFLELAKTGEGATPSEFNQLLMGSLERYPYDQIMGVLSGITDEREQRRYLRFIRKSIRQYEDDLEGYREARTHPYIFPNHATNLSGLFRNPAALENPRVLAFVLETLDRSDGGYSDTQVQERLLVTANHLVLGDERQAAQGTQLLQNYFDNLHPADTRFEEDHQRNLPAITRALNALQERGYIDSLTGVVPEYQQLIQTYPNHANGAVSLFISALNRDNFPSQSVSLIERGLLNLFSVKTLSESEFDALVAYSGENAEFQNELIRGAEGLTKEQLRRLPDNLQFAQQLLRRNPRSDTIRLYLKKRGDFTQSFLEESLNSLPPNKNPFALLQLLARTGNNFDILMSNYWNGLTEEQRNELLETLMANGANLASYLKDVPAGSLLRTALDQFAQNQVEQYLRGESVDNVFESIEHASDKSSLLAQLFSEWDNLSVSKRTILLDQYENFTNSLSDEERIELLQSTLGVGTGRPAFENPCRALCSLAARLRDSFRPQIINQIPQGAFGQTLAQDAFAVESMRALVLVKAQPFCPELRSSSPYQPPIEFLHRLWDRGAFEYYRRMRPLSQRESAVNNAARPGTGVIYSPIFASELLRNTEGEEAANLLAKVEGLAQSIQQDPLRFARTNTNGSGVNLAVNAGLALVQENNASAFLQGLFPEGVPERTEVFDYRGNSSATVVEDLSEYLMSDRIARSNTTWLAAYLRYPAQSSFELQLIRNHGRETTRAFMDRLPLLNAHAQRAGFHAERSNTGSHYLYYHLPFLSAGLDPLGLTEYQDLIWSFINQKMIDRNGNFRVSPIWHERNTFANESLISQIPQDWHNALGALSILPLVSPSCGGANQTSSGILSEELIESRGREQLRFLFSDFNFFGLRACPIQVGEE